MSKLNDEFDREVAGPDGQVVKVVWMPNNRVRLDLFKFGKCAVTHIFPNPKGDITKIEIRYENP